jgi:broad specificity phosphatase PhoE
VLLHLVRHAESLGNASRSGAIDCDLSDLGRAQAQAVAAELKRQGVDRVLSSPYRRTLCTAQAIAAATGAPIEAYPLLHEHHTSMFPPDWPLMTRSELVVNFPGLILPDELADRGWCARYGNQRLVLVTHGSPAGKLVQAFLGGTDAAKVEVTIANASITTLESSGWKRYVRGVNRTDHLRDVVAPPAIVENVPATVYL